MFPFLFYSEQVTSLPLPDPTTQEEFSSPGIAELPWEHTIRGLILHSLLSQNPQQLPGAGGRVW